MTQRKTSGIGPKTIRWIWVVAFAPFVLVGVMLLLTAFGVFGRMPSFEELENPRSNLATEIYSEDGKVLGTFFVQNRSYVQYADLFPSDSTLHIRLDGHDCRRSSRRSSPRRTCASAAIRASTSRRWPVWR